MRIASGFPRSHLPNDMPHLRRMSFQTTVLTLSRATGYQHIAPLKHNLISLFPATPGRKIQRSKLRRRSEDPPKLEQLARLRTVPKREAQRSGILPRNHAGENIAGISAVLVVHRWKKFEALTGD